MGLVSQVLNSLKSQNISKLTRTYTTLALSTIVDKLKFKNVDEAERHIIKMVGPII